MHPTLAVTPYHNEDIPLLVDELTYRSYAHNRNLSPKITPERWQLIYGEATPMMEVRFQREMAQRN